MRGGWLWPSEWPQDPQIASLSQDHTCYVVPTGVTNRPLRSGSPVVPDGGSPVPMRSGIPASLASSAASRE